MLGLGALLITSALSRAPVTIAGALTMTQARYASAVAWVSVRASDPPAACQLTRDGMWVCTGVTSPATGVVVVMGDARVSALPVRAGVVSDAVGPGTWGRLVVVDRASPAESEPIAWSAYRINRSAARPRTVRFTPVADPGVTIVPVGPLASWVSGDRIEQEAFVTISGPGIADLRISQAELGSGAPDAPLELSPLLPLNVGGRVETERGDAVGGAVVELFQPLHPGDNPQRDDQPYVRVAAEQTDPDGRFSFGGLVQGPYELVAAAGGARRVVSLDRVVENVVVKLIPTGRADGRVVRDGQPVPGARVRLVPSAEAWVASRDPFAHITPEVITDINGRFELPLPEQRAGSVQIIAPDGATARTSVSDTDRRSQLHLGEIAVPAPRELMLTLLDPESCELAAAGPLDALGITVVRARPDGQVHWLAIPEPGVWILSADCGNRHYELQPPAVTVGVDDRPRAVYVQLSR